MTRRLFLVAYDVRDPRRLAAAGRVVTAYATGGQKSVHECWLTGDEQAELSRRLTAVLDESVDSLAFFPVASRLPVWTLGVAQPPLGPDYFYLGE